MTRLGLGDTERELLEAGALLANAGLFISHSGHHKHSYYVIRNSEHLMGFTDREIEVIALVARYHRKSPPSADKHPEFAALGAEDQAAVRAMAALLRVAIGMDRNHDAAVDHVNVKDEGDTVTIADGGRRRRGPGAGAVHGHGTGGAPGRAAGRRGPHRGRGLIVVLPARDGEHHLLAICSSSSTIFSSLDFSSSGLPDRLRMALMGTTTTK